MDSDVYVVIEISESGLGENKKVIGVCPTLELANQLSNEVEQLYDSSKCIISEADWEDMYDTYCDTIDSYVSEEDMCRELALMFPEYSIDDIKKAVAVYDGNHITTEIQKVKYYTEIK